MRTKSASNQSSIIHPNRATVPAKRIPIPKVGQWTAWFSKSHGINMLTLGNYLLMLFHSKTITLIFNL